MTTYLIISVSGTFKTKDQVKAAPHTYLESGFMVGDEVREVDAAGDRRVSTIGGTGPHEPAIVGTEVDVCALTGEATISTKHGRRGPYRKTEDEAESQGEFGVGLHCYYHALWLVKVLRRHTGGKKIPLKEVLVIYVLRCYLCTYPHM